MEKIYRLKIEIREAEKEISRTVDITGETTLHLLHNIILTLFNWTNSHLHEFHIKNMDEISENKEKKIKIKDIFQRKGQKIIYLYDFGDSWEHEVKLEKTFEGESDTELYPNFVSAIGVAPEEDSGGIWGWEDICHALTEKDKENPMYEEYLEWMGFEETDDIDLYSISEGEISVIKKDLKVLANKNRKLKLTTTKNDEIVFVGDDKEIKKMVKLLKTESFIPDRKVLDELLKNKKETENYLIDELEKATSTTEATMIKNYCYIFNLLLTLGEMDSEKAFPEIVKILKLKGATLDKMFGDLIVYLRFFIEKIGKNHADELYELLNHVDKQVEDTLISSLISIYLNGKSKDESIAVNLLEYMDESPKTQDELDNYTMKIFNMATEGFKDAEVILTEVLKLVSKEDRDLMKKGLKDMKKTYKEQKPKNIEDLYKALEILEGDKNKITKMLHGVGIYQE